MTAPRTPRKRAAAKNSGKQQQRGRPFAKGQSGNARGRPKGSRNLTSRMFDELGAEHAESIIQAVIRRARKGDMTAAGLVLRRLWPEPRGRSVPIKLSPIGTTSDAAVALAEIVAAVGRGEIVPEEARAIADLIGRYVQAVEVGDIEKRLAALEAGSAPPPADDDHAEG